MFKLIAAKLEEKTEESSEEPEDTSVTETTEKPNPLVNSSTHKIVEIPKVFFHNFSRSL